MTGAHHPRRAVRAPRRSSHRHASSASPVAMPIRTGNSSLSCAATAASTAERGDDERRAHTIAGVLEQPAPVRLDRRAQHLVMGGQRRSHRVRVGLPPTGRTLNIGEQERHYPDGAAVADTRTGCHNQPTAAVVCAGDPRPTRTRHHDRAHPRRAGRSRCERPKRWTPTQGRRRRCRQSPSAQGQGRRGNRHRKKNWESLAPRSTATWPRRRCLALRSRSPAQQRSSRTWSEVNGETAPHHLRRRSERHAHHQYEPPTMAGLVCPTLTTSSLPISAIRPCSVHVLG